MTPETIAPKTGSTSSQTTTSKNHYKIEVDLDSNGCATSVVINNVQIEPPLAGAPPALVTQCHDNASSPFCSKRVMDTITGLEVYHYDTAAACPIPAKCARF
jgi:hypothetical protein